VFSDSLQVFVISNGDVLTGCYPFKPVGNILKDSLEIRRECPGCTCGVESSLAMKRAVSSAFYHLGRLTQGQNGNNKTFPTGVAEVNDTSNA